MHRAVVSLVVVVLFAGCEDSAPDSSSGSGGSRTGNEVHLDKSQFPGNRWPLTVDSGSVRCEDGSGGVGNVLFETSAGDTYAVNGTAQTNTDYPEIDEIWKAPDESGLRPSMEPIMRRGLKLCR